MQYKEILDNVYWVGDSKQESGLHCNPYLIVDGDEAVLIEPGSVIDFETVYENVKSIIPIEKISYIILSHQDPDVCASMPLFEKNGFKGKISTFWRTAVLIKYYGIQSEVFLVNENNYELNLQSGRKIQFLLTPYMHFPGSMMTYDTKTKTLFSSDIFGAFSTNWSLYADENYIEAMKVFHENYMPSNDIIRPVMELLLSLDINMIAPQHGSIIDKDIKKHITTLRDLECGAFLNPIKKELAKSGGYTGISNSILKRFYAVFNPGDVKEIFKDTSISIDQETGLIEDFNCTGKELWDMLFDIIFSKKGLGWITVVETLVTKIVNEYGVEYPQIFDKNLYNIEKIKDEISSENIELKKINERLQLNLDETREQLLKDGTTGLYNENFFRDYMKKEIEYNFNNGKECHLMIIDVDNTAKLSFQYGESSLDEIFRNITYLLKESKGDNHSIFKLYGSSFAYYAPTFSDGGSTEEFAERLRMSVSESELFPEKITVSIGVVKTSELQDIDIKYENPFEKMYEIAKLRVRLAKNQGMDTVCSISSTGERIAEQKMVLVIESDSHNADVLKWSLEQSDFRVEICSDGLCALDAVEKNIPDIIIAEMMIPKLDGFLVREKMIADSKFKKVPFILLSYKKDEESVQRAISLGIEYYLKKPYMLSEVIGLVKTISSKQQK